MSSYFENLRNDLIFKQSLHLMQVILLLVM